MISALYEVSGQRIENTYTVLGADNKVHRRSSFVTFVTQAYIDILSAWCTEHLGPYGDEWEYGGYSLNTVRKIILTGEAATMLKIAFPDANVIHSTHVNVS